MVGQNQQTEQEIEIYARINDWSGLDQAKSVELQVQGEIRFKGKDDEDIRQRVRQFVPCESLTVNYRQIGDQEMTFKTDLGVNNGMKSVMENNTAIEKPFSVWWLKNIAKKIIVKKRFSFPSTNVTVEVDGKSIILPEVIYEVDVFLDALMKKACPVCKIDIEMDKILEYMKEHHPDIKNLSANIKVSHLPFKPSDMVVASGGDENIRAKIGKFWESRQVDAAAYFGEE